jgi:hypothetical protein
MRAIHSIAIAALFLAAACGKKESPEEAAKKQADELDKAKGTPKPAEKIKVPVQNEAHIPCEQLIPDLAPYQAALGETDPLTVSDNTKTDAEAAAVCALMKGGKPLTKEEQDAMAKKTNHVIGSIPGDKLASVTAYCWTVETLDNFKKRCPQRNPAGQDDESMGNYACVNVIHVGPADVDVFSFYDEDTKCILKVNAGPSMTDNDKIRAVAQAARDNIGPDQIAVNAPPPSP